MANLEKYRKFLKAYWWLEREKVKTDKQKKVPPPPLQKPYPATDTLIDLLAPENMNIGKKTVFAAIKDRKTHRKFSRESLTLEELSFLLWATQGVHEIDKLGRTMRTVPSAGARHPFETYLLVNRVKGLAAGRYRYLPLEHKLLPLAAGRVPEQLIAESFWGQSFIASGAVIFVWTVIPYRSEWQYLMVSPKMTALDAGHVCQNLYIACEAIGAGTCAVGMYDQERLDAMIGADGRQEFAVYAAPVGKVQGNG
ncbi:MAG TPA: SagB/ThcOx family dehydrogenase [Patescibacteria group bacterium]|nr:SagB/ThcOx family dehydrogenase [Patescibacteria group bacterium]